MEKALPRFVWWIKRQGLFNFYLLLFGSLFLVGCIPVVNQNNDRNSSPDQSEGPIPSEVAKVKFQQKSSVGESSGQMLVDFDQHKELLLWRSDTSDQATSVWVLGNPSTSSIENKGVGHVSCFYKGIPVFIVAGENRPGITDEFFNNKMAAHFNVLRVNGQYQEAGRASLNVHKIRERGGSVRVNPSACYPDLDHWFRDIFWTENEFRVVDDVLFMLGKRGSLEFNWNFVAKNKDEEILVFRTEKRCRLETDKGMIEIQCNRPFKLNFGKRSVQGSGDFFGDQYRRLGIIIEDKYSSTRLITRFYPNR